MVQQADFWSCDIEVLLHWPCAWFFPKAFDPSCAAFGPRLHGLHIGKSIDHSLALWHWAASANSGHVKPNWTKQPITDAKMAKTKESAAAAKHLSRMLEIPLTWSALSFRQELSCNTWPQGEPSTLINVDDRVDVLYKSGSFAPAVRRAQELGIPSGLLQVVEGTRQYRQ